ncbi:MAG: DUF1015 domain-containing protein [Lachnospiraceae bacterium]
MANIKAFKSVRPKHDKISSIAALPYDVYNRSEAKEIVLKNPLSFLRIDRAESNFPDTVGTYDDCVYEKAKELLNEWIAHENFIQDEKEAYYIYELEMNGRIQTGLVAVSHIEDYENNRIKKHENTREEKELDRIRHIDICSAQTGPIFLAYRDEDRINDIVAAQKVNSPIFEFSADDGIIHRGWMIDEQEQVKKIKAAFLTISDIYIADGHHRCASAVKVGRRRHENNKKHKGDESYNYFLSVLFPKSQLEILDYNRVVKDLNSYDKESFLSELTKNFKIENMGDVQYKPTVRNTFGMYLENSWYKLTFMNGDKIEDIVESLDVSILQDYILDPILNIKDPKTDNRIDFIGGIRGMEELEKRVKEDCKVAFSLYPTSMEELFSVADHDLLMPPKSTWFEPKLRSGLFIHLI